MNVNQAGDVGPTSYQDFKYPSTLNVEDDKYWDLKKLFLYLLNK